jgi:hypothetical protein
VLVCAADGPSLSSERDASTFMSGAWAHGATIVAILVERVGEDFFRLETRLAGEVIQKFVNYHL